MLGYFYLSLMVTFTVCGQLFIKKGAMALRFNKGVVDIVQSSMNTPLLLGLVLALLAPIFYILALRDIELSKAFAFSSANYVMVVFGGKFYFNEQLNVFRFLGVFMIVIGIILFGIK